MKNTSAAKRSHSMILVAPMELFKYLCMRACYALHFDPLADFFPNKFIRTITAAMREYFCQLQFASM